MLCNLHLTALALVVRGGRLPSSQCLIFMWHRIPGALEVWIPSKGTNSLHAAVMDIIKN